MLIAVSLKWFAEYAHVLQMLWHKGITVDRAFYLMLILMAWFSVFLAQLKNWSCRLRVNVHSSICSENEKWPGKFPQHLPTYANKKELNVFPFPMWNNYSCSSVPLCIVTASRGWLYCVRQKIPPLRFSGSFSKRLGILDQFLHTYYTFLTTLDYKFLFNYLQLWRSHAIVNETTHRFFYILLELLSLLTEQIISNMFVDIIKTAHLPQTSYQWLANVWTRAFRPIVDILSICELNSHA